MANEFNPFAAVFSMDSDVSEVSTVVSSTLLVFVPVFHWGGGLHDGHTCTLEIFCCSVGCCITINIILRDHSEDTSFQLTRSKDSISFKLPH